MTELNFLKDHYSEIRELPDGRIAGVAPLLVTTGLFVGLDLTGYSHRYCYDSYNDALSAMRAWDGKDHPPGPWIKRKGLVPELLGPGAED